MANELSRRDFLNGTLGTMAGAVHHRRDLPHRRRRHRELLLRPLQPGLETGMEEGKQ